MSRHAIQKINKPGSRVVPVMTKVARLKMQEDAKPTGRDQTVAIRFMPKKASHWGG